MANKPDYDKCRDAAQKLGREISDNLAKSGMDRAKADQMGRDKAMQVARETDKKQGR